MPLRPLFFRLNSVTDFIPTGNAINATIFSVQRRQRSHFSGLNAVDAANFPVKGRQRALFAVNCR